MGRELDVTEPEQSSVAQSVKEHSVICISSAVCGKGWINWIKPENNYRKLRDFCLEQDP